ncbi:hypothetical protein G6F64_014552 [Rhizopus arrhizus]|uniref:CAAX prenyl protease 2/Lysostaphin resistance protein A-like domain-containing protein n=1 Tax=Rhizopus oryzae TaxID=64495 RepID=A0A9P7BJH2_RHIOR|nr:hypothetical protein G6F64_014552 [Rhizopus arrhizus]
MQNAIARFPLFLVLFAVVLAPAYEELLFRRVLFGRLWKAGRPWLGIILSSLAFALVHEVPGLSKNSLLGMLQLWLVPSFTPPTSLLRRMSGDTTFSTTGPPIPAAARAAASASAASVQSGTGRPAWRSTSMACTSL